MPKTFPDVSERDVAFAFKAASACRAAGIHDPETEIAPLRAVADAAVAYRRAVLEQGKARAAWNRFALSHDNDDPGHEPHREKLTYAVNNLRNADEAFQIALGAWRRAAGLDEQIEAGPVEAAA